ncbi:MAG: dihydroxy-acid dehydratase, partial [Planctomycetota bacterium]
CVGHVSPEAASGGPIGKLKENDIISIDITSRSIAVLIDDAEFSARTPTIKPESKQLSGWLGRYARSVSDASQGAVLL